MRYIEPFIEAYMQDIDLSLLKENLKLSPQERFDKFAAFMQGVTTLREDAKAERSQAAASRPSRD